MPKTLTEIKVIEYQVQFWLFPMQLLGHCDPDNFLWRVSQLRGTKFHEDKRIELMLLVNLVSSFLANWFYVNGQKGYSGNAILWVGRNTEESNFILLWLCQKTQSLFCREHISLCLCYIVHQHIYLGQYRSVLLAHSFLLLAPYVGLTKCIEGLPEGTG